MMFKYKIHRSPNRRWHWFLLLLLCFSPSAVPDSDKPDTGSSLTPFSASYVIDWMNTRAGTHQVVLTESTSSEFVYTSTLKATGLLALFSSLSIIEESGFSFSRPGIKLHSYNIRKLGAEEEDYILRTNKTDKTIELKTETGEKTFRFSDGQLSNSLFDIQLMMDARRNKVRDKYSLLSRKGLRNYDLNFMTRESTKVPAGKFKVHVYKFKQQGKKGKEGKRGINYYLAPELGFFPVRIDYLKKGRIKYSLLMEKLPAFQKNSTKMQTAL